MGMALKAFTTKLDAKLLQTLRAVSEKTHIPQAELVREGLALALRRHQEDIVSSELRLEIEALLLEDRALLKRLA